MTRKGAANPDGVNLAYIPLTRDDRIVRWVLLDKLVGRPRESWDPAVCAALRKQEEDDQPLVAALEAMFGKGKGYSALHIYLLLGAQYDEQGRHECARWLATAAISQNPGELEAFVKAKKAIALADEFGPRNRPQAWAHLFAVGFLMRGEPLPPRSVVYDFLARNRIAVDSLKPNAKQRLWDAPILRDCPKDKPGRPRVGSKRWRVGIVQK